MPSDLTSIADPRLVLLAWAAGLGLIAGYTSFTRVVGPGFTWLAAGTAALIGMAGAFGEGATWARVGMLGLVVGALAARRRTTSGLALAAGGVAFLIEGAGMASLLPVLTAAVALGGVTGEMGLGHWYLIDPRLPRWALKTLAVIGIVGLVADGILLATAGGFPGGGATVAFWLLLTTSVALMIAVLATLRYPAYSGVMAATGLSYLAVLTTLGAVFLGRALVAGIGPFAN